MKVTPVHNPATPKQKPLTSRHTDIPTPNPTPQPPNPRLTTIPPSTTHPPPKQPPKSQSNLSELPITFDSQFSQATSYTTKILNTGAFVLWSSKRVFYVEPSQRRTGIGTVLKVERGTGVVRELTRDQFRSDMRKEEAVVMEEKMEVGRSYQRMQSMFFSCFLGIIDLQSVNQFFNSLEPQQRRTPPSKTTNSSRKLLLFAQNIQLVCSLNKKQIQKIIKPVYIFYNPKDKQNLSDNEALFLLNLGFILQENMYYSFFYRLTLPFWRIQESMGGLLARKEKEKTGLRKYYSMNDQLKKQQQTQQQTKSQQTNSEKQSSNISQKIQQLCSQFNWSTNIQIQLKKHNISQNWLVPLIQGFVGKIQTYVSGEKFRIAVLSRRSRKNGGPLQYATGFEGNENQSRKEGAQQPQGVANYVQTETIIHFKNIYFTVIQARGTVPLYWKYTYSYGLQSAIKFTHSIQQNYRAFFSHIKDKRQKNDYEYILLLNLLDKTSSIQKRLIQNYQYILKKSQRQPGLFYTYFNIWQKCQNKDYKQLTNLINNQLSILLSNGYSVLEHRPNNRLQMVYKQKVVILTNCAKCIDRTNIAQSRIAAWLIVKILADSGVKISGFTSDLGFLDDGSPFGKLYRTMWADNGDAISRQYSGTMSTQSVALRTGKISYMASIDHGLTSLLRAFRNVREEDNGKSKTVLYLSSSQI